MMIHSSHCFLGLNLLLLFNLNDGFSVVLKGLFLYLVWVNVEYISQPA
jgi:hypothetical protein